MDAPIEASLFCTLRMHAWVNISVLTSVHPIHDMSALMLLSYNPKSHELDVKLREPNLGPRLVPLLEAGDAEGTGRCSKQHLLKVLMLHFNVLLTPGEQACLVAEWQCMDHITGEVSRWIEHDLCMESWIE